MILTINCESFKNAATIARTIEMNCRRRATADRPFQGANLNGQKMVLWSKAEHEDVRIGNYGTLEMNGQLYYFVTV